MLRIPTFIYFFLGSYVGERIAVKYLLSQSERGDLLSPIRQNEIGATVPELTAEVEEEEESFDLTVCLPADLSTEALVSHQSSQVMEIMNYFQITSSL